MSVCRVAFIYRWWGGRTKACIADVACMGYGASWGCCMLYLPPDVASAPPVEPRPGLAHSQATYDQPHRRNSIAQQPSHPHSTPLAHTHRQVPVQQPAAGQDGPQGLAGPDAAAHAQGGAGPASERALRAAVQRIAAAGSTGPAGPGGAFRVSGAACEGRGWRRGVLNLLVPEQCFRRQRRFAVCRGGLHATASSPHALARQQLPCLRWALCLLLPRCVRRAGRGCARRGGAQAERGAALRTVRDILDIAHLLQVG